MLLRDSQARNGKRSTSAGLDWHQSIMPTVQTPTKRLRLGSEVESQGKFQSVDIKGEKAPYITPLRSNAAGWVQLETPTPLHGLLQSHERPPRHETFNDVLLHQMSLASSQTMDPTQSMPQIQTSCHLSYGVLNTPAPTQFDACSQDFSTTEVKAKLRRIRAQTQIDPLSSGTHELTTVEGLATWPGVINGLPVIADMIDSATLKLTGKAFEGKEGANPREQQRVSEESKKPLHIPPGFTSAADVNAVEQQQKSVLRRRLRRRLEEWNVPPRVVAVSSQLNSSAYDNTDRNPRSALQNLNEELHKCL